MLRSSYIYTVLKLFQPFEGNLKADAASSENEFDTPDLNGLLIMENGSHYYEVFLQNNNFKKLQEAYFLLKILHTFYEVLTWLAVHPILD